MSVIIKLNDRRVHFKNVPDDMKSDVTKRISAQWKPNSRDITKGLSYEQELVVMPNIIGVKPNDSSWTFKVRDFWSDFSLAPDTVGKELDIRTRKAIHKDDGGEEIEIEIPLVPEDYMAWQLCLQSSLVAKTPEDMDNLEYFDFILINKQVEEDKLETEFAMMKEADIAFARLTSKFEENEPTIDLILELLRDKGDPAVFELKGVKKEMFLREKKQKQPVKFLKITKDADLSSKALIAQLVTYNILSKEGNDYYYLDDKIGSQMVLIAYLKDATKSTNVGKMKSQLDNKLNEAKNKIR